MSRAERFWNWMAPKYAESKIKDMKSYEKTLADTRKYLKKTDTVLEIGCGTGMTALKLTDNVKTYDATDISSTMISIGKQKAEQEKKSTVNFFTATLDEDSIKKKYNAVLSFNLMHLLKNTDQVMKQIHSLVAPGGLFITKTPCLGENKLMGVLAFFIRLVIGPVTCFTVQEFKKSITDAGFKIVEEYEYPENPPRVFIVAKKIT